MAKLQLCTIEGCGVVGQLRRGWCNKHYRQWQRRGSPTPEPIRLFSTEERIDARSKWVGDCLEWQAFTNQDGYGVSRHEGSVRLVHKVVWELSKGKLPEHLRVDHRCFNRRCLNIEHLRLVTHQESAEHRNVRSDSRTGVKNVSEKGGKYVVTVMSQGVAHYGGVFVDIELAAGKAKELRLKLHTHNDFDRAYELAA